MAIQAIKKCTRCGGSMLEEPGRGATCMLCGEEAPEATPSNGLASQAPSERDPRSSRPLAAAQGGWDQLALEQLHTLLTRIERLNTERKAAIAEAVRLRRALHTWGAEKLPLVPGSTGGVGVRKTKPSAKP